MWLSSRPCLEDLRRKKDQVQRQADDVARQGSLLGQVQHALDVLVRDVIDIAGRLDHFAGSWAVVGHDAFPKGPLR